MPATTFPGRHGTAADGRTTTPAATSSFDSPQRRSCGFPGPAPPLTGDRRVTYCPGVDDEVFRALADPSRRTLLDRLFERDGQTLGELEAALPGMTRFGV